MFDTPKGLLIVMIALFGLSELTACNTVEGAGRDLEAAGDSIEDSAEDHKHY